MERVVFDLDLYIDWINLGSHEEILLDRWFVRYMSTVVLLELQAGALEPAAVKVVGDLHRTFARKRRLLSPSPETFWRTGSVLRVLQRRQGSTSAPASDW